MDPTSTIAAALSASATRFEDAGLASPLDLLAGGRTVVVSRTLTPGRVELARALAAVAGVPAVSTLYALPESDAGAAAVIETIRPASSLRDVDCATPGASWHARSSWPAEVAGRVEVVGST